MISNVIEHSPFIFLTFSLYLLFPHLNHSICYVVFVTSDYVVFFLDMKVLSCMLKYSFNMHYNKPWFDALLHPFHIDILLNFKFSIFSKSAPFWLRYLYFPYSLFLIFFYFISDLLQIDSMRLITFHTFSEILLLGQQDLYVFCIFYVCWYMVMFEIWTKRF